MFYGGLKDFKYILCVVKYVCCIDNNVEYFLCFVNCYFMYLENIKLLVEKVDVFYFYLNCDLVVFSYQKVVMGINIFNKILFDMLCCEVGLKRKMLYSL